MLITINFERNVQLAPMDLATALHKRCRKSALLFTFLVQKKGINILYFVLVQILLSSCEAAFQAAHFNTMRNLKFNYMGGPMGGL